MEKRLITAALPYINNVPHLGHIVGSHLPADIFARYCRLSGNEVLFVGGTDEHGSTTEISAAEVGLDIETFSKRLNEEHKKIYDWFGISYDNFSRTSSEIHYETVSEFFKKIYDNGYISKGFMKVFYSVEEDRFLPDRYIVGECPKCGYEEANGDQCENCTALLDPLQLKNPRSSLTGSKIEIRDSQHLFFSLNKLSDNLKEWIESKKDWKKQVTSLALGWIKEGLKERCITRDLKHGVPVPIEGFEDKVFYVWFDAPIGYVSFTREISEKWKEFWKGKVYNFLGKDNIPFHTIFWPGEIIAEGEFRLPEKVVGYQYLNYEGGKFSKSKKRGVFCEKLPESGIPADVWRSYLVQVIPESSDSEFKWKEFQERINSDLIGNFGNFVNRTLSFANSKFNGKIEKPKKILKNDKIFLENIRKKYIEITDLFEKCELRRAYSEVLALSSIGNRYLNDNEPWIVIKEDKQRANDILFLCSDLIRILSVVISPFLPTTSYEIWKQMNLDYSNVENLWNKCLDESFEVFEFVKVKRLFNLLEDEKIEEIKVIVSNPTDLNVLFGLEKKEEKFNKETKAEGIMTLGEVTFEDFAKLDLRVAEIESVEDIEGADKLYKIGLDVGEKIGKRTVCAGIKAYYSKEDLIGRKVVYFSNLKPRKLRGIESQGMLFAAFTEDNKIVNLLNPGEIPNGSQVS